MTTHAVGASTAHQAGSSDPRASILKLTDVTASYGRSVVLREINLSVAPGSIVAMVGPNGAGKTTLLRVASGLMSAQRGSIELLGHNVTAARGFERVRRGLCLVPEGRGIFPNLTVQDNLRLWIPATKKNAGFEPALEAFPILRDRLGQLAGRMSGGQQQMLALSRCFLTEPKIVLLDEISMGLAPRIIDDIFAALLTLAKTGTSLLLVEQYVHRALEISDRLFVLSRGRITFDGNPADIDEETLSREYLGDLPS